MPATATAPRGTSKKNGKQPEMATAARPAALFDIPVADVLIRENVRTDVGDLEELAESIRQHGILQPIRVQESYRDQGKYELIYGQRRFRAAELVGLEKIPALVEGMPGGALDVVRLPIQQLVENVQRRDLNALEEAKALRGILDASEGMTQDELAAKVGRSRPAVTNLLRILDADAAVQELVAQGRLSAAHAKAIAGLPIDDQLEIAKDAVEQGWSAHDTERQIQWKRDQAERDSKYTEQARRRAESTVGWLKKHDVPKDAVLFIGRDQHGTIRKAGWKNLKDQWDRHSRASEVKDCDCVAFENRYDGNWEPVCVSTKHRRAFTAEEKAKDLARRAEGLKALAEGRERVAAAVAEMDSPFEHRLLLWSVLREGYNWSDYARELSKRLLGKELTISADTDLLWQMIADLPDDQVAGELGAAVAAKVLPDLTTQQAEWTGRSHQAVRRVIVQELGADAQLITGKKPAKGKKAAAA